MAVTNEGGLLFSFAEMEHEVTNMAAMAKPFLAVGASEMVIQPWLQQLRSFASSHAKSTFTWSIPIDKPIWTIRSDGQYEPDDQGELSVLGMLSCIWDLRIPKQLRTKKKGTGSPVFELIGRASTRLTILEFRPDANHVELARWRFEMGDSDSPGCHFHVQVLGEENDECFPKSMSVPRLPGLLLTPMDALEFLLAEMFQGRWRQHASQGKDAITNWSRCQRKRLVNLLNWQCENFRKAAGSPWTSFKTEKPHADMLLQDLAR
jgi:hypothetical protein